MLIGIVVDQHFDVLMQILRFHLEHFQKDADFPVHAGLACSGWI
jgi:hypothetical protein